VVREVTADRTSDVRGDNSVLHQMTADGSGVRRIGILILDVGVHITKTGDIVYEISHLHWRFDFR